MNDQNTAPKEPSHSHETLLAAGWELLDTGAFIELVGNVYVKQDGEDIRYGFISGQKHQNRRGVLHGGVLAAFADRALAMAGRRVNDDMPQATIELSLRFIDAVQIGEFVESTQEVVRKTRSVIFVRGTLMVGPRVIATADGIWKILTPRQSK
ncbi:MAG: PaaI family thioesterase [Rhizobiales bacterium]|nr:PaaI family thioesterase [Hyphomicrobiales bacterium]